jgi:hypothetical protein
LGQKRTAGITTHVAVRDKKASFGVAGLRAGPLVDRADGYLVAIGTYNFNVAPGVPAVPVGGRWSYSGSANQLWRLEKLSSTGRTAIPPILLPVRTSLRFQVANPQKVTLSLMSAKGQILTTFIQSVAASKNQAALDLTTLPAGLYTLQFWKDNQLFLRKLVIAG